MIDSNRINLPCSLATALKDRPHGIPVQPNRSLPLRPPPPLPARISLAKAQNNSPITQKSPTSKSSKNNGDADDRSKDHTRNDDLPDFETVGINFYDSKDNEEDNYRKQKSNDDYSHQNTKDFPKSRHTKSLNDKESDESNSSSAKRRKSFHYYETIRRDGDRNERSCTDWAKSSDKKSRDKEKRERHGKKRKSSSAEENSHSSDVSREAESPKVQKLDATKSKNFDRVESSGWGLPTIYKYRNSKSSSPHSTESDTSSTAPDTDEKSDWKPQTSSNNFKLILPKPDNIIPECPVAIPIEVAHAMNRVDSENNNCIPSIKPKINKEASRTLNCKIIEEPENTLPSMPSLEDMMLADSLNDKSRRLKNEVHIKNAGSNVDKGSVSFAEARVMQSTGDLISKQSNVAASEAIQKNIDSTHGLEFDQPDGNESFLNLTTVFELQMPGRSPEFLILTEDQLMGNSKVDGAVGYNNLTEATTLVSLASSIKPGLEIPKTIEDIKIDLPVKTSEEINNSSEIFSTGTFVLPSDYQQQYQNSSGKDEPQYVLQLKSPGEFEVLIKDTSGSPQTNKPSQKRVESKLGNGETQDIVPKSKSTSKVDEARARYRKKKHISLKLQEYYAEETLWKHRLTQITDPIRLKRGQQKLNCATKKIENLRKQLNKLTSNQYPEASQAPSRIQVRRDLVQPIQLLEKVVADLQSPQQPDDEIDGNLREMSPSELPRDIITISETDSSSSYEDTAEINGAKLSDDVDPYLRSSAEIKFNANTNISENDVKMTNTPDNSTPKDDFKVDNSCDRLTTQDSRVAPTPVIVNPAGWTSNNAEYLNKNLPPVSKSVPARLNNPIKSIPPLVRDRGNFSPNNFNGFSNHKSPSEEQGALNLTLAAAGRVDKEISKPTCNCLTCKSGSSITPANNAARIDGNNFVPTTANDVTRTTSVLRQTNPTENSNAHPVPNYPVHRNDYRTTENVQSMFSKDNGGANINLSSPLQGHSAILIPQSYARNLTAQGYPIPAETNANQTMQWQSQHPQSKPSMQYTPDQNGSSQTSILASHLRKPQSQEVAKYSNSINSTQQLSHSRSTEAAQNIPANYPVTNRLMAEPFPTLANWVAQNTKPANNSTSAQINNTHLAKEHGYKTTGSDMYKMAATAIDTRQPGPKPNTVPWAPERLWPEQPRPVQGYSNQRSNLHPYRREYTQNPRNPQNSHNMLPPYPGSEMFERYPTQPYQQSMIRPQATRSIEHSSQQSASHSQQNAWPYHPQATLKQRLLLPAGYPNQVNSGQAVNNSYAMMSQLYPQQTSSTTYSQAVLSQWQSASNYQTNYMNSSQYNGYNNVTTKNVDDSMGYRQGNKNLTPLVQSQQHHEAMTRSLSINNPKVRSPIYNMTATINNALQQDVRSSEPLDLGRSYLAPHLAKVHKSPDRSSTLKCSRCGMTGPKFNCNGCETAFYCNEHCQAQHWGTHYLECSKKMPKLKKVSLN